MSELAREGEREGGAGHGSPRNGTAPAPERTASPPRWRQGRLGSGRFTSRARRAANSTRRFRPGSPANRVGGDGGKGGLEAGRASRPSESPGSRALGRPGNAVVGGAAGGAGEGVRTEFGDSVRRDAGGRTRRTPPSLLGENAAMEGWDRCGGTNRNPPPPFHGGVSGPGGIRVAAGAAAGSEAEDARAREAAGARERRSSPQSGGNTAHPATSCSLVHQPHLVH